MNATNEASRTTRSAEPSPFFATRWTKERETVREICMQRSRAGFLAARLVKLAYDCTDASSDLAMLAADTDVTRKALQEVVQRYALLLMQVGEPRDVVMRLVEELALDGEQGMPESVDGIARELRRDVTRWAAQAMADD